MVLNDSRVIVQPLHEAVTSTRPRPPPGVVAPPRRRLTSDTSSSFVTLLKHVGAPKAILAFNAIKVVANAKYLINDDVMLQLL
jgi:hypothetical protein